MGAISNSVSIIRVFLCYFPEAPISGREIPHTLYDGLFPGLLVSIRDIPDVCQPLRELLE
jgi:hypothetical protein